MCGFISVSSAESGLSWITSCSISHFRIHNFFSLGKTIAITQSTPPHTHHVILIDRVFS